MKIIEIFLNICFEIIKKSRILVVGLSWADTAFISLNNFCRCFKLFLNFNSQMKNVNNKQSSYFEDCKYK